MNDENGSAHAIQTQAREVVGKSGNDGLLPSPIERLHHDRRIARIGAPGIADIRASIGVGVTERQHRTAIARLAFNSDLVGAEPSLEKIRPRAALVRELNREKSAKLLRYRKAVARLGVENIDDVLGIVVEGAEGELCRR